MAFSGLQAQAKSGRRDAAPQSGMNCREIGQDRRRKIFDAATFSWFAKLGWQVQLADSVGRFSWYAK
jgi:hypothetical protein